MWNNQSTYRFITATALAALTAVAVWGQTRLAVPSYQQPGGTVWQGWAAQGPGSVGIMIVNLNKGDNQTYSSAVASAIAKAQLRGMYVLGYTYTGYGSRSPQVIHQKIDAVYQNYRVDGIFFDEAPTDCSAANKYSPTNFLYFQELTNYVRQKQSGARLVVMNPGTSSPNACWMSITNILVNWESAGLLTYENNYVDYPWVHQYPPDRFWHILLGVSQNDLPTAIALAQQRNAGWIYISDSPDNAYNQLPVYWAAEAKDVAQQGVQAPYATSWPASQNANGGPANARVSFRWKAVNGLVWQIFLDADQNAKTGYQQNGVTVGAEYMVESSSAGVSKFYKYAGSGSDWNWVETPANAEVAFPDSGIVAVTLDRTVLGPTTALTYQIQSLDQGYVVLSTSYAIPVSLNNTGFVYDIFNHP